MLGTLKNWSVALRGGKPRDLNTILQLAIGAQGRSAPEQMDWLQMLRDHIATSLRLEPDDLSLTPFHEQGGRGRMFALFGEGWRGVLEEMNVEVAA